METTRVIHVAILVSRLLQTLSLAAIRVSTFAMVRVDTEIAAQMRDLWGKIAMVKGGKGKGGGDGTKSKAGKGQGQSAGGPATSAPPAAQVTQTITPGPPQKPGPRQVATLAPAPAPLSAPAPVPQAPTHQSVHWGLDQVPMAALKAKLKQKEQEAEELINSQLPNLSISKDSQDASMAKALQEEADWQKMKKEESKKEKKDSKESKGKSAESKERRKKDKRGKKKKRSRRSTSYYSTTPSRSRSRSRSRESAVSVSAKRMIEKAKAMATRSSSSGSGAPTAVAAMPAAASVNSDASTHVPANSTGPGPVHVQTQDAIAPIVQNGAEAANRLLYTLQDIPLHPDQVGEIHNLMNLLNRCISNPRSTRMEAGFFVSHILTVIHTPPQHMMPQTQQQPVAASTSTVG